MSSVEELKHLQIPLKDILLATNEFADVNCISRGGFGKVYQGFSEKHGIIAVKRLDRVHGQGDREFLTEIALLSVYKHENIVSLHGFCDENREKILVYKHETKGSLDKYLNSKDLTWSQRLQICIDAAHGLKYLHDDVGPQHRILHRDVKSSNILLDENWKAKISDFGLSKIGPANVEFTFLISNPLGTIGYVDPEFVNTGVLTKESDVFSFGVVLFEVLCGRLARDMTYNDDRQFLFLLAQKHYESNTLGKIIPPKLLEQINAYSFIMFSTVAYQCLKKRQERPKMNEVVQQLQKALNYQRGHYNHILHDNFAGFHQGQSSRDDVKSKTKSIRADDEGVSTNTGNFFKRFTKQFQSQVYDSLERAKRDVLHSGNPSM